MSSTPPPNSGLIKSSQFNGGGFLTVGLQFDHVYLGGGLTVSGFDNENNSAVTPLAAGLPITDIDPDTFKLPTLGNAGLVSNSQYNDGGFGILRAAIRPGMIVSRRGGWDSSGVTRGQRPVDVGLGIEVIQPGASTSTLAAADVASPARADAIHKLAADKHRDQFHHEHGPDCRFTVQRRRFWRCRYAVVECGHR